MGSAASVEEQGGDDDARDERTQKCLQPELFTGNTAAMPAETASL